MSTKITQWNEQLDLTQDQWLEKISSLYESIKTDWLRLAHLLKVGFEKGYDMSWLPRSEKDALLKLTDGNVHPETMNLNHPIRGMVQKFPYSRQEEFMEGKKIVVVHKDNHLLSSQTTVQKMSNEQATQCLNNGRLRLHEEQVIWLKKQQARKMGKTGGATRTIEIDKDSKTANLSGIFTKDDLQALIQRLN